MSEQGQGRVLIVDDQREVARALCTMLTVEHPDWHVADVPSGEEALLDLAADRYDAVVVDFRLPGISGRDLLLRVRQIAPAVRIVFMSGYELDRIRRDLGDMDVAAVLQKPLDMDEFLGVVSGAVQAAARERATGGEAAADAPPADNAERQRARLEGMIAALRIDLDAQAAALVDLAGEPAMIDGPLHEVPHLGQLTRALAGHFDTLAEVGQAVGGPVEATHTYRGVNYDVYALSAGPEFFVVLVYPSGGPERVRTVQRHGRPAVDKLTRVLGEMLGLEMPEPAPEPPPAPDENIDAGALPLFEPDPEPEPPAPPILEPPPTPEPPGPERDTDPENDPVVAMSLLDEDAAPLDIDLSELEFDLETADADALEAFWEEAGGGPAGIDGEAMSHEEAVRRGLIPEDVDLDDEE